MPAPAIEVHARAGQPLGMPSATFLSRYWQKHPLLIRGAFPDFTPTLSPDELAGLACTEGALARIVTHTPPRGRARRGSSHHNDGAWKLRTGPFDDATFAALPDTRWTLLVQDVDKWDAATAKLLEPFAFIPSWRIDDVMISYAVDAGGVGAHVDQYDVFLLQGLGRRCWSIDTRSNPPTGFRPDVELKLLQKFSPSHSWILEPGDVLYLPPGVPHDGVAMGECMTVSIGMRAPAAGELLFDAAAQLAETLPETQRLADPDLKPVRNTGELDRAALQRVRRALGPLGNALDDGALADWFGCFITRYRAAQLPVPRKRPVDRARLARDLAHANVVRDSWCRFAWRRMARAACLYAAGQRFAAPLAWAKALAGNAHMIAGTQLLSLPQRTRGVALLAALMDAGCVKLNRRHPR